MDNKKNTKMSYGTKWVIRSRKPKKENTMARRKKTRTV